MDQIPQPKAKISLTVVGYIALAITIAATTYANPAHTWSTRVITAVIWWGSLITAVVCLIKGARRKPKN